MKRLCAIAASASLFALAACGDAEEEAGSEVAVADQPPVTAEEYDPMARDYVLSEEAQTRRAAFDADGFNTEYAGYRDAIVAEADDEGTIEADEDADTNGAGGDAQATSERSSPQPIGPRDANTNMRARKDMSWSYLDRNSDNRLSVAEYAIWAVPLDPTEPKANDQRRPFVTAEQANKAADSFFYYDIDGDTYLDRREFTAARRGENFDPAATPS